MRRVLRASLALVRLNIYSSSPVSISMMGALIISSIVMIPAAIAHSVSNSGLFKDKLLT